VGARVGRMEAPDLRNDEEGWHPAGARVGIMGLGLIGGSLARDLTDLGARVLGFDADPKTLEAALASGVVHEALPGWGRGHPSGGPPGAAPGASALARIPLDVLVLAVPVAAALPLLASGAPHLGHVPLVTDVGSTKASITSAAGSLGLGERFVGSHPLAGSHVSGWKASRTGLFRDARVYLCPVPKTGSEAEEGRPHPGKGHEAAGGDDDAGLHGTAGPVSRESLRRARGLWAAVGAFPQVMDAAAHDRLLAWTSHLPQAASTALALALAGAGVRPGDLGPGGRDVTRLAASSPSLWTGIALDNAGALLEGLAALEKELATLREGLARGDGKAVHAFFSRGASWRE